MTPVNIIWEIVPFDFKYENIPSSPITPHRPQCNLRGSWSKSPWTKLATHRLIHLDLLALHTTRSSKSKEEGSARACHQHWRHVIRHGMMKGCEHDLHVLIVSNLYATAHIERDRSTMSAVLCGHWHELTMYIPHVELIIYYTVLAIVRVAITVNSLGWGQSWIMSACITYVRGAQTSKAKRDIFFLLWFWTLVYQQPVPTRRKRRGCPIILYIGGIRWILCCF